MPEDGTPTSEPALGSDALSIDAGKTRFRTNLLASTVPYVLQTGVGIWFTPYLISNLGVAVYGLIPLTTQLAGYVSLLAMVLSRPVGRFVTADLARGGIEAANRTFNTALFGSLAWGLVLLPLAVGFSWLGPAFLDVPVGHESGVKAILLAATLSLLLGAVCSPFSAFLYAHSRFDITGAVTVMTMTARVGIILLLFSVASPALWHVATALLAECALGCIANVATSRRVAPGLRIDRRCYDSGRFRELLSMGGWLTIGQIGGMLYMGIDLVVLNTMVGAHTAGLYAPVFQLTVMVRSLASMATGILAPTMIALHASGDNEALIRTTGRACKLLGVTLALPLGLLCGLAGPLLRLWLGEEFEDVGPVLTASLAPQALALAAIPLTYIPLATNRVKWPGVMTVAQGVTNLGLALMLTGYWQLGMYGVVISRSFAMVANSLGFLPAYGARVLQQRLTGFWPAMLLSVVATLIVGVAAWYCGQVFGTRNPGVFLLAALVVAALYFPLAYFGLLRREDRELLGRLLLRKGEGS